MKFGAFCRETGFRQTAVGKIPNDWQAVQLEEISNFKRGFSYRSDQITEEAGIRFITINDIEKEGGLKRNAAKIYIRKEERVEPEFFLENEDILIANTDMSRGFIIGAPVLIDNSVEKAAFSMDLTKLFLDRSKVDSEFLFYYLKQKTVRRKMKSFAQGTNVLHLNHDLARELSIALPTLPEQERIVAVLSVVDETIRKTSGIIAKNELLKKGLMQQLLTKGVISGFMFDTNIFDGILDGKISLEQLRRVDYCVTHLQKDEIDAIHKPEKLERKEELLKVFDKIKKKRVPTEGVVVDVSRLDEARIADAELYDKMLTRLRDLDKKAGRKKTPENQARDSLIAITCIEDNLTLISDDKNLRTVIQQFGGRAISLRGFLEGEHREFKDTEIGRIPKEWEVVELEKVAAKSKNSFVDGPFGSELRVRDYVDEGVRLTRLENIGDGSFVDGYKRYISEEKFKQFEKYAAYPGDIIISEMADPIARACIVPTIEKRYMITAKTVRLRVDEGFDVTFVMYAINSPKVRNQAVMKTAGSTRPMITLTGIKNLKMPVPPLREQQKIAAILSTIDRKLELEKNEKRNLDMTKQALMDLLLTGKIRIKVD